MRIELEKSNRLFLITQVNFKSFVILDRPRTKAFNGLRSWSLNRLFNTSKIKSDFLEVKSIQALSMKYPEQKVHFQSLRLQLLQLTALES